MHRLDPWQRSAALDDEALRRLYSTSRDLMRRNLLTPIARQRHAVHARGGRPCPRCGTPIRIQPQGEHARLTYFCPRCQAVPVARPMAGGIESR
jgi:endonuclease VIII